MIASVDWDEVGQISTKKRQTSRNGTEHDGAGQVVWSSIIYEWSMAEKSGTDIGGAATGVTNVVVCNGGGSVQRWI